MFDGADALAADVTERTNTKDDFVSASDSFETGAATDFAAGGAGGGGGGV